MIKDALKCIKMVVFDFDGVFTDNRVLVLQDGTEGVFCSRADGFGLELLKRIGVKCYILSTEKNPVVRARAGKLKVDCLQGCEDKVQALKALSLKEKIPPNQIAYLGNDINDIPCLMIVGFPACVRDAHPTVRKCSVLRTTALGGYGAVREFCEKIAASRGDTQGKKGDR